MDDTSRTFLGRWSRRKVEARQVEAAEKAAQDAARAAADAAEPEASTAGAQTTTAGPATQTAAATIGEVAGRTVGTQTVEARTAAGASSAAETQTAAAAAGTQAPPAATGMDAAAADPHAAPASAHSDAPALPTLADVARLTADSDYSVFMAKGVAPEVKNAAMKKLFSDPHYNIMDGLDIYIDDYSSPEIMPQSMLRKMASARVLNLFTDDDEAKAVAADRAAAEQAATDAATTDAAEAATTDTATADTLPQATLPEALQAQSALADTSASLTGTATDEPGSNPLPREAPALAARPDNRLHVATAAPRAPADVLASAPRPDVSRADDGATPDSSQSGNS